LNALNSATKADLAGLHLSRFNQILIALLIIQLVVVVVVFWPAGSTEGSSLTLDSFEMADVVGLTITNDQGEKIVLRKGSDGWGLPEAGDYPVNADQVTELLEKLVGLNTNRLVTNTEASHNRLQVGEDEFVRQLVLETAGGQSYTLYLGSSPNAGSTHIRLAGQDEAYLTSDLNTWQIDSRPSAWIDNQYFSVAADDITRIRLQNANADLTFEKDDQDEWTMVGLAEGEELLTNNVTSLVNRAASIQMVEPVGKTEEDWFELDQSQATVTVTTNNEDEGEQTFTIRVGAKNEDNQHIVSASTSPYYVLVAEFSVNDFIERDREAYLAQPEEEPSEESPGTTAPDTGGTTESE